jgi:hypothetical protein
MINTEHYKKLELFANNLGYKVIESDCDSWHYNSKIICNNSRRRPDNRIIYLAHECGHAQFFENKKHEYNDIFPGFCQNGINNKVSVLEQEVFAWDEGLKIIKKLNIPINIKKFAKIKMICLKDYL